MSDIKRQLADGFRFDASGVKSARLVNMANGSVIHLAQVGPNDFIYESIPPFEFTFSPEDFALSASFTFTYKRYSRKVRHNIARRIECQRRRAQREG